MKLAETPVEDRTPGVDHKIKTSRNGIERRPDDFPDPSLDTISIVRFSQLSRSRHAETAQLQAVRQPEHDKGARNLFCAPLVHFPEFRRVLQRDHRGEIRLVMLDRDARATLVPSGLQHQAAAAGFHARPKPMGLRTLAIVRLISSLRHPCALLEKP